MKNRWQKNRSLMLKRVDAHKTSESQREYGKLGARALARKRPWFEIIYKNKSLGLFQDDTLAANSLGWTIDVFRHFKRGNKKVPECILIKKEG